MKRLSMIFVALVACLAIGMSSVAAAGTAKVKTTVSIAYQAGSGPYGQSNFHGKVKSKKKACIKGRTVKVKNVSTGATVGTTKSDKKGNYTIGSGSSAAKGTYVAKVKKKVTNRFICKKAKSPTVTVS